MNPEMEDPSHQLRADAFRRITPAILDWYERHRRKLPWRDHPTPYQVWVSEVMLQQTQVGTVMPYYQRFLAEFPNTAALAEAPLDRVLKVWENLGYYSRARHMHRAAGQMMAHYGGRVPDAWDEIKALPGVGDYIAGAVLSIAYGKRVPAVDGNVRRVLGRIFAIETPIDTGPGQARIRSLAAELLPESEPGAFNQGLMDLGAAICTPKHPACPSCPVQSCCRARRAGLENTLPVKSKRRPVPHRPATAAVIRDRSRRLLVLKRPGSGLLGGLWKWPGGEQRAGEDLKACLRRNVRRELGVQVRVGPLVTVVRHQYTHFRLTLHVFQATRTRGAPTALACAEWRWIPWSDLDRLAFSKADRLVLEAVRNQAG